MSNIWRCPECGHTETQPSSVISIGHFCHKVRRLVQWVPVQEQGS